MFTYVLNIMSDDHPGIIAAVMGKSEKTENGRFRSNVAFVGITKKLMMLVIVAVAVAVDKLMGTDGICRLATIGFYAANEAMSIIENASKIGVPFPASLLDFLRRIRDKNNGSIGGDQYSEHEDGEP